MIVYDLSNQPQRVRLSYYNLLSPAGKAHLAQLMQEEKEVLENFVLSYETPQLRKLEARAKRDLSSLTDEERVMLDKGKKSFKGLLSNGTIIEDEKSISVISEYIDCLDILETDLQALGSFAGETGQQNSEIILGKQMSYWNLHPDQFSISVYQSLFDSPEYTRQELERLFNMKLGMESLSKPPKVFKNRKEVEPLLFNYVGSEKDKQILTDKLANLHVVGETGLTEYRTAVTNIINLLLERDAEFDFSVYEKIKEYLPQYHNQKTRYFIYLLSQFNYTQIMPVSTRIDFITLQAFYRKADELCSS